MAVPPLSSPVVAVLTGGASTRMGVDKATVEVAGRAMIDWVLDAARAAGEPLLVGRGHGATGVDFVADPDFGVPGPLAGLVAATTARPGRTIVVLGVDQPLVRPETLGRLAQLASARPAVPLDRGVLQVTCAAYPSHIADAARAELSDGGSLQSLLRSVPHLAVVEWADWGEDGRSWLSADRPADVRRVESIMSQEK